MAGEAEIIGGRGGTAPSPRRCCDAVSTCDLTGGQKKAEPDTERERERAHVCECAVAVAAPPCVVSLSPAAADADANAEVAVSSNFFDAFAKVRGTDNVDTCEPRKHKLAHKDTDLGQHLIL